MQMRILVTGGTGLIGSHAVDSLVSAGHEVFVLTRTPPLSEQVRGERYIVFDMLAENADFTALFKENRYDILLHLAWETEHGKFWTSARNALWLAGSLRLADGFLKSGGRRIVCAGTCVEYDPPDRGACIAGETPLRPVHPYSIAKDSLRRMLGWMVSGYGANLAWGRIFLVMGYGEHPDRLVPGVIRSLLNGELVKCTSGRQIRDFMHAKDLGAAFARLAESDFDGEVNICSGEAVTIARVVNRIAEMMGHPELVQLGALPDRAGEPANLWGDAGPLLTQTGFRPAFSLETALADIVAAHIDKGQEALQTIPDRRL